MNFKVNLSENEYQINLLNEENAKLRNINKTLSKGYKFPGKKTRKKQ